MKRKNGQFRIINDIISIFIKKKKKKMKLIVKKIVHVK